MKGDFVKILLMYSNRLPVLPESPRFYTENNIEFIEYDAQNDKARKREMLEFSGGDLVVPCIVENGEYIQSGWGNPLRG